MQASPQLTTRTGVREFDQIIEKYLLLNKFTDDMPQGLIRNLSDMRNKALATNMCQTVNEDFVRFVEQFTEPVNWQIKLARDLDSRLWGLDIENPAECGDPHTVAAFVVNDSIYTVDFTAAQYGCNLFPAVMCFDSKENFPAKGF